MSAFIVTYGGTRLRIKNMIIHPEHLRYGETVSVYVPLKLEPPPQWRWTRKGRKLLRHMMRNKTPMKLRRIKP